MIRIIVCLLLFFSYDYLYSQNIAGEYIYKDGAKYNVSESLKLFSDSTFEYSWDGGLTNRYSSGNWKLSQDTIYLTSKYLSDIKSISFENDYQKCLYFSNNNDSISINTITIIVYFNDNYIIKTGLGTLNRTSVIGEICTNIDKKQREILEYRLKNIENKERVYFDYLDIDSIVFIKNEKKIGLLASENITGNRIQIDMISENYFIFQNEKFIFRNKSKIFWLDKDKKTRLLRKKRLLTRGVFHAGLLAD